VRPAPGDIPRVAASQPAAWEDRGRRLLLPAGLPGAVARAFARQARARLEAGALLYGTRGSGDGAADTVHGLVIPQQEGSRARYHVPHAAIAAASAATIDRGWVTVAQLHSHPAADVEHSWYDDRHAVSVRAISIVLPFYGRDPGHWPGRIGVHEYQDGWWHLLTAGQAAARISFAENAPLHIIDLRGEARD
jgi:JAB domain-containing protein similar to deubiquitination enzymes